MAVRDQRGRFVKGNSGGPGRPTRRTEAEYLVVLTDAVTIPVWKKIIGKAVEAAIGGDHQARQWLSRHLIGDGLPGEHAVGDEAEQLQQQLHQVDEALRPVLLIDQQYPTPELARIAAELLIQNRIGGVFETMARDAQ